MRRIRAYTPQYARIAREGMRHSNIAVLTPAQATRASRSSTRAIAMFAAESARAVSASGLL